VQFYSKCLFLPKCGFIPVSTALQVRGLVPPSCSFWKGCLNAGQYLTLVVTCGEEALLIWPFGMGNDLVLLNL